jgi:hypothetical protein
MALRNADFQSAVSQNFILRRAQRFEALATVRRPADCKSAIQQIANLRYPLGAVPPAGVRHQSLR